MAEGHASDPSEAPGEPEIGPSLAPLRRRGESHRLALISAAAVVFIAVAIAKPWSESAPLPSAPAATPTLATEIARSSTRSVPSPEASEPTPPPVVEAPQEVEIVVQPGDVSITITVVCTEEVPASPSVAASAEPVDGLRYTTIGLVCTDSNLQVLTWVYAIPSAP
jgi:hypothetical protein